MPQPIGAFKQCSNSIVTDHMHPFMATSAILCLHLAVAQEQEWA